jgi:uncharacterized protein (DUF1015 family)
MVHFQPFRAYLPELTRGESIEDRVSPPYDVISDEERKELQSHKYNVTNITLGGVNGDYSLAGQKLQQWMKDDILVRDRSECFYLYEQQFVDGGLIHTRFGLIGALAAEGYSPNGVIPHEETFSKVKEDRLNLLRGTETHCESIFGLFDDYPDDLEKRVLEHAEKLFSFSDTQGVSHTLHRISEEDMVREIGEMFLRKRILIADGHHRYETACRYAEENARKRKKGFVLATLVSMRDRGLVVRPTHRLISGLKITEAQLLERLSKDFALSKASSEEDMLERMAEVEGKLLGLMSRQACYVLAPRREGSTPLQRLDTSVCEEHIIKPIVQAKDNEGAKVAYDHDEESVSERVRDGEFDYAIMLSPPSLDLIWDIASAGGKMPKKSTYFFPKMWSGLVYLRMR